MQYFDQFHIQLDKNGLKWQDLPKLKKNGLIDRSVKGLFNCLIL